MKAATQTTGGILKLRTSPRISEHLNQLFGQTDTHTIHRDQLKDYEMARYPTRQQRRTGYREESTTFSSDEYTSNDPDDTTEPSTPKPTQLLSSSTSHNLTELEGFLREECPDEISALPPITDFIFEEWRGPKKHLRLKPINGKRISIGVVASHNKEDRETVYLYMGSENANRIGLTQGSDNKELQFKSAQIIEPAKPFRSLCEFGRFFTECEKKMLRAFACYIFIAAGHIETMQGYRDFAEDFTSACTWIAYGQNADAETSSVPPVTETSNEATAEASPNGNTDNGDSPVTHSGNPVLPSLSETVSQTNHRNGDSKNQNDHELQRPAKKIKLDDAISRMQRRNQEHEEDITTLTKELAMFQRGIISITKHEHTILQKSNEIGNLREQLDILTAEKEALKYSIDRLKRRCSKSDKRVIDLQDDLMVAKEAEEEESEKRKDAERKLKKYLDAQKRMAAEFDELGG